jgi:hypothetical protein
MRNVIVAKKSSAAAVSSWGFSGYIAVLPKESKVSTDKTKKKEEPPPKASLDRNCR